MRRPPIARYDTPRKIIIFPIDKMGFGAYNRVMAPSGNSLFKRLARKYADFLDAELDVDGGVPRANPFVWLFVIVCLLNGFVLEPLSMIPWAYWCFDALTYVVLPVVAFLYALRPYEGARLPSMPSLRRVGLVIGQTVLGVFIFRFVYNQSAWIDYYLQQALNSEPNVMPAKVASSGFGDQTKMYLGLYMALTAGIVEEWVYRRVLLRELAAKWGLTGAVALTVLLFAAVHWEGGVPLIVQTTVIGLGAGIWAACGLSLLPLIIAHTVHDLGIFWHAFGV